MSGLWCYLHFPLLPLEMQYTEETAGPAAVADQRHQSIWLVNTEARALGVRQGMALATASSLCPELNLLSRKVSDEPEQLEALALWAGQFSAQIALDQPDGLWLESGSMLHYFGGLEAYWQQLSEQLDGLQFSCTLATGHTPKSARILAHAGGFCGEGDEIHLEQLRQLALSRLLLPVRTLNQLTGLGFSLCQQLLELPRAELAVRLGDKLLLQLDQITGLQPDPPDYFKPPVLFRRRQELSHEVCHSQGLLFPLKRLLAELEGFLRLHQSQATALELKLRNREGEWKTQQIAHASGESRAESWLDLLRLRLETQQLEQPVIELILQAEALIQLDAATLDLFATERPAQPVEELFSRLQSRLGDEAVSRLELQQDHRPEFSWAGRSLQQQKKPKALAAASTKRRPGWLLESPEPVSTAQIGHAVTLLDGPERIASGWWDQQPVRRDYYTGRWPDGRLGWLYRDASGDWFVHGWFG